jgi:hypothetical protein
MQLILFAVQVLTLIAIVVYVWKTWEMAAATRLAAEASQKALEEMRLTREEESRPFVIVFFELGLDGTTVRLVITNVGKLPAKNVKFSFNPELRQGSWSREPVSQSPKIKEGIGFLPPDVKFSEFFDAFVNLQGENLPTTYRLTLRYEHPVTSRIYEDEQVLEWKSLSHKLGAGNEWHRLAEEIKKLLEKIAEGRR